MKTIFPAFVLLSIGAVVIGSLVSRRTAMNLQSGSVRPTLQSARGSDLGTSRATAAVDVPAHDQRRSPSH